MSDEKTAVVKQTTPSGANKLIVGIDLGTSSTAMMAGNGISKIFDSVVGYPRDVIGVRLLGAPFVVGKNALEKRSFLELRYPLEDGVVKENNSKDLTAAKQLLKYAIEVAEPQPGDEIYAVIGVPARASAGNKAAVLQIAQDVAAMAVVISEPFLVAYHYGKLLNAVVVDIGAGTIDVCALKGSVPQPEDQITIKKAGNHIDAMLMEVILDRYPDVQINLNIVKNLKETYSFVGKAQHDQIKVQLRANSMPVVCDITEEVSQACESIVPEIVEAIEFLIKRFSPEYMPKVLQNIILAGGGSRIKGLADVIAGKLQAYGDIKIMVARDADFDAASGALKIGQDLPSKFWSQLGDVIGEEK
ncbi:Actin-like protein MamK [Azospirillaceae bacterium]